MEEKREFEIVNQVLKGYRGPGGDIIIPDGVTEIAAWAFPVFDEQTSITVPDSVVRIDENAFRSCRNITLLTADGGRLEDRFYTVCEEGDSVMHTQDDQPVFLRLQTYAPDTADSIRREAADWCILCRWSEESDYGYGSSYTESGSYEKPVPDSTDAAVLVEDGRFVGVVMRSKGTAFNKVLNVYDELHAALIRDYQGKPLFCARGGSSFSSDDHSSSSTHEYYLKPAAKDQAEK